jgi:hypothetical protein
MEVALSAAPRASDILNRRFPWVRLRSTPGSMLSAAPRASDIFIARLEISCLGRGLRVDSHENNLRICDTKVRGSSR